MTHCLVKSGTADARLVKRGVWRGTYTKNRGTVFVYGPYSTAHQAAQVMRSMRSSAFEIQGGAYVVFTAHTSTLSAQVNRVGICLNVKPRGPQLSF